MTNAPAIHADVPATPTDVVRLGCVSYLNTTPLIEGLGKFDRARLTLTPPSGLIDLLLADDVDLGVISAIDYQRSAEPLAVVPVGCIACDGPTMTVRLYARRPIEELTTIAADVDSHTAVTLLRILMREQYNIDPELTPFDAEVSLPADGDDAPWPEAMLVIGDKVITRSPPAALFPHQLDLGQAWKDLTGLPFVYAIWMCRASKRDAPEVRLGADLLNRQRRHNEQRLAWIAAHRAPRHDWPADVALTYIRDLLHYDVHEADLVGLERFYDLAATHGLIEQRRPIETID